MAMKLDWKFDLTLFDGAGGGAAAGGGGEGAAGADAGVAVEDAAPTNPNRRRRENPLAHVKYGKQAEQEQTATEAPGTENQPDPESEWKAAKEKYKDFFGRDTSAIVQDRLKNSKQAEATLAKLAPIFEGLGSKYGKEATDIDGILAAYTDDDSLYEEDAAKAGMPVSAYKQLKQLQADKQAREEQDAQSLQEQQFQQHIQGLITSFDADVKSVFPNADLRTELQNPQFQRLTSPEVGVSAKDAYWLIHRNEIESQAMQVVAQKTQQKMSLSIQSGMNRPVENGSRNVSPALDIRDDPSKWSKADREEVKRRVRNGERIML